MIKVLLFTMLAGLAHAAVSTGSLEVAAGVQVHERSGYLAKQVGGAGPSISLLFLNPVSAEHYQSFFEIQWSQASFDAQSPTDYPFAGNHQVSESLFAIIPNISVYNPGSLNLFVGIGPALLMESQSTPKTADQTYGVFVWQAGARFLFTNSWSLEEKISYRSYAATFGGNDSFFADAAALTQIGYTF